MATKLIMIKTIMKKNEPERATKSMECMLMPRSYDAGKPRHEGQSKTEDVHQERWDQEAGAIYDQHAQRRREPRPGEDYNKAFIIR